jgi:mRNA interferase MazF
VVLADVGRGDRVLCQVTSKPYGDSAAVKLDQVDFASGSLQVTSYVRPGKLFTASTELIAVEVGFLNPDALRRIVDAVVNLLRPTPASSPLLP